MGVHAHDPAPAPDPEPVPRTSSTLPLRHVTFRNRLMSTSHAPGYVEDKHPEAALPALPRGEGQGRPRAHHVRRLVEHRAGLAFRVRPDLHRRRLDRSRAAGVLRAHPPPRLRDHVPDHPHGASHAVERRGLAAAAGASGGPGARAPLVPQGDGPRRHSAGGARVRRRRGALPGGRARRHRAARPRTPHPPVLDPAGQPPHRRVRRQPSEPRPLRPRSPRRGAPPGRGGLPGRLPDDGRRAEGRRPHARRLPGAREALRRHGPLRPS